MLSMMLFIFLALVVIVSVLFYMARLSRQQYNVLRSELAKTQDILRSFETRFESSGKPDLKKLDMSSGVVNPLSNSEMDSPLTMAESSDLTKTVPFDSALDLHFDPELKGRSALKSADIE